MGPSHGLWPADLCGNRRDRDPRDAPKRRFPFPGELRDPGTQLPPWVRRGWLQPGPWHPTPMGALPGGEPSSRSAPSPRAPRPPRDRSLSLPPALTRAARGSIPPPFLPHSARRRPGNPGSGHPAPALRWHVPQPDTDATAAGLVRDGSANDSGTAGSSSFAYLIGCGVEPRGSYLTRARPPDLWGCAGPRRALAGSGTSPWLRLDRPGSLRAQRP